MKTKLSLLFYLKKPRNYQTGPVPVYLRLTVDSKRSELATGRECDPKIWNAAAGRVSGNKEAAKSVNAYLGNLEQQFLDAHASLVRQGESVTAETVKNKFLGIRPKERMLMAVIAEHNRRMHSLIGQEYAIGTFRRYEVLRRHTENFLKVNFNVTDYDICRVDFTFIGYSVDADPVPGILTPLI